jgi:hypothetical protein
VTPGQNVSYCISSGGKAVEALVSIVYPDGTVMKVYTDENGCITLLVNEAGSILINVSPEGYAPQAIQVSVSSGITPIVMAVASGIFVVTVAGFAVYFVFKKST